MSSRKVDSFLAAVEDLQDAQRAAKGPDLSEIDSARAGCRIAAARRHAAACARALMHPASDPVDDELAIDVGMFLFTPSKSTPT